MEISGKSTFRDLIKNIASTFHSLVNEGEVDYDVPLTGELAKDPISSIKEYYSSQEEKKPRQRKSVTRTKTNPEKTKTSKVRSKEDFDLERD